MTPSPNPVEPTVSDREALRHRPGRALLAAMTAMKVARLLHHSFVEPIFGQGWLFWCPGLAVLVIVRQSTAGKWLYRPSKRPEAGKALSFYLRSLTLGYLMTRKP